MGRDGDEGAVRRCGVAAESPAPARLADAAPLSRPRRRPSKQGWRGETAARSGGLGPSASKLVGLRQPLPGRQCLHGGWSELGRRNGGGFKQGMAAALSRELACQQNYARSSWFDLPQSATSCSVDDRLVMKFWQSKAL